LKLPKTPVGFTPTTEETPSKTKTVTSKRKRVTRAHSVKAETGAIGYGATIGTGGGESQQIPQDIIRRTRKDVIEPPLGECSFENLAQLLTDSTDFSTVVEQESTDVAGRGWHIDPMDPDTEMDEAEMDAALALLTSPHPSMTLGDIVKCVTMDYLVLGNAWMEVIREGNDPNGLPSGLAHAPGIMMRINASMKGFVMLSHDYNNIAYFRTLFSDPDDPSSLDSRDGHVLNEMIFFRRYHPGSAWYGVPKIASAFRAIKGNIYSAERNIRFFLNRAYPEWSISIKQTTDNINREAIEELEQDLVEHFRNLLKGDDFRTLINSLPSGVELEFQELAAKLNDGELRNYRLDNRDEILRAYQMMPNRVGVIESGNLGGGTGESQIEIYNTSVVKPLQEMFERVIDALLHAERPLGLGLKTVRFKFDEIDSIDEQREATIAATISSTGWLTVNEGRAYSSQFLKIHLDPIDEPWADYPLQIVLPQLESFMEPVESPLQEEPGQIAGGLSQFGTPLLAGTNERTRDIVKQTLRVDRAYRRMQERRLGRLPEEEPSANGS